jgi:hypothetical protein
MEDRSEELMALKAAAYQLLQDAILDQVMGKYQGFDKLCVLRQKPQLI